MDLKKPLVILINPGHDDEVPEAVARSFGARSRDIPREDPPISIINLGGYIRDHGYDVRILDTHVEKNFEEILRDFIREKPLVIGLSVILGKFTKNAISLTRFIKSVDRRTKVIWGGKLTHLAGKRIFDEPGVDYVITGEGEIPLLSFLNALRDKRDYSHIPALGYRENGRPLINPAMPVLEDLDSIYQSRDFGWDLIRDKLNYRQIPYFVNLYTSRGCRFNCSFCYLKDIKEMQVKFQYRRRSAENVIREIDYLNHNFGINVFTFGDDDFLYDLKNVVPILEHIRRNHLYIEHFWTNIYNLTDENIRLLKGICQTVCYSVETVPLRLQRILNKTIPTEKVFHVNNSLRDSGINTVHNFLFGIPTETDDEIKENIDFIKRLKKINPYVRANCYILSPIPGTPIFEYGKQVAKKDIPWTLEDLGNFHFRYMGQSALKFRPYLSSEDNSFYERLTVLANELFTEINQPPTKEQLGQIRSSKRLNYIFGNLDDISCPVQKKKKYILNDVIAATEKKETLPVIEAF